MDRAGRLARTYTFYMVGFLLLKFLLLLCENGGAGVLGAIMPFARARALYFFIGLALWGAYGVLRLYASLLNYECLYQSLLLECYIDREAWPFANYGVVFGHCMTLSLFPEISQYGGAGNVMWGWGNTGSIRVNVMGNPPSGDAPLYLSARPMVFSEQATLTLSLATRDQLDMEAGKRNVKLVQLDAEGTDGKRRGEMLLQCIRGGGVDFYAPLSVECLVFTAEGQLVLPPKRGEEKTRLTWSHPVGGNAANEEFGARLMEEIREEVVSRIPGGKATVGKWGILALFLDCRNGNAGLGMVLKLKETADELGGGVACVPADSMESLAGLMTDPSIDKTGRYCLLIDIYAQKDQFEFSRIICEGNKLRALRALGCRAWRNWLDSDGDGGAKDPAAGIMARSPSGAEPANGDQLIESPFLERLKNFFQTLPQRLERLLGPRIREIIMAFVLFLLDKRIDPVVVKAFQRLSKGGGGGGLPWHWDVPPRGLGAVVSSELLPLGVLAALLLLWLAVRKVPLRLRGPCWLGESSSLFGNRNVVGPRSFHGYDVSSVHFRLTDRMHRFPEKLRGTGLYKSFPDDGVKFCLTDCNLRGDGVECVLGQCRFSDVRAVQEMVKAHSKGVLREYGAECEEQFDKYADAMRALSARRMPLSKRGDIPPHSLCAHTLIVTRDGYVVVMERSPNVYYFPSSFSVSSEEQLSVQDVYDDDTRLRGWVERMCEEELGLTKRNSGRNSIGDMRLMSIFQEKDVLNVSLALVLRLNIRKRQLQAIIRHFPRKDYEGTFTFLRWEELYNRFARAVLAGEKTVSGNPVFHPSSVYRMYWGAIAELRFDIARRLVRLDEAVKSRREAVAPAAKA
jgi:hypothetical protein